MNIKTYEIQVTKPNGTQATVCYCANGFTNAWYIASELNPDCKIKVLGLLPEWEDTTSTSFES